MQSTTIALSLGALSFILLRTIFRKAKGSLPPGPPGLPLIGNVLDMPSTMECVTRVVIDSFLGAKEEGGQRLGGAAGCES
ncbi:hypothetical protein R3P38DRAFT_3493942 [Favolaschia claudopus]|uniref:Uncharacterized protein n=1 Tax=Favolaschia claudopus TaxID=2862362 RepID=A0AAW0C8D8_9AGAR